MLASSARGISYLHWIVISIACSTRLEVFQCLGRKDINKIAGTKDKENHHTWIDFTAIYKP